MRRAPSAKQVERKRRRAAERRVLQLRVVVVVALVALLWGSWSALMRSQLFEIKHVDVRGVTRLSATEVIAEAGVPNGATLLRVDEDAIATRLGKDPWIAQVRVSARPPSTLRITVTERVPSALVDTGTSFWYVDGNARVIAESIPTTATALPVVRDLPDFVAEPGVVSTSRPLRNALSILTGIDGDLRESVRTITASSVTETGLLTASGVEIMIGEATQLREKSAIVKDILAAQGASVVFIDVRSVERPISRSLNQ